MLLAGAVAAFGLAACSTQSPTQTQVPYQPADGVAASSGPVQARDLVVLSQSKGAMGRLSGSLINDSTEPVVVTFMTREQSEAGATAGATVSLKGREQRRIETVQFASIAEGPGSLTSIVMSTPTGGKTLVSVPVLLPEGYYSTMTATPMTTSATSVPTSASTPGTAGTASTQTTAPGEAATTAPTGG